MRRSKSGSGRRIGSGINNTFRQIGVAVGIAGLGAIFQDRVQAFVPDLVHRAPRLADRATALAGSISQGMAAVAGAVLTLILIRPRDFHGSPEQQHAPARGGRRDRILEEAR